MSSETYTYKGISAGKYVEGTIDALNQDEASFKLKEQKIIITNLTRTKKKVEKDKKKKAVTNFLNLLKEKQCTESDEYAMLIDTIISIDNTVDAVLAKADLLKVKKKYKASIEVYRTALEMADNDTLRGDVKLSILEIQYNNQKHPTTTGHLIYKLYSIELPKY